jgi:hypothetical protein
MKYTLYRIYAKNTDADRVIMYGTDMNGERSDRFWDFGAVSVFDVGRILTVWEEKNLNYTIESVSKTEFIRKFGKNSVAF